MVDGAIWRTARWTPRPTTSLAPTRLLPPEPLLAQSLPPATSTLYRIHAVPNPRCTVSTLYRIHAVPNPRCTESTLYRLHRDANGSQRFRDIAIRRESDSTRPTAACCGPLLPLLGYCCCPPATDKPDKRSPVGRVYR